jgi:CubicO group peptidase (beta-lactamase class C family)
MLRQYVSRYSAYGYLNSSVLGAAHRQVIYAKGVGNANAATHTLNSPEPKFGIALLTKELTAVLALQQIDRRQAQKEKV